MPEPRVLVTYHTVEGQSAKIAERIGKTMRADGADVQVSDVSDAPSPAEFDAVVLGDSIHVLKHSRALKHYLKKHVSVLNTMPAAIFQVSLTSAGTDAEHESVARGMVDDLLVEFGFDPDAVGLFAGAVMYTKYGWIKRKIVKSIVAKEGGDTDTSRDFEYTDWDAVDDFARDVLRLATA